MDGYCYTIDQPDARDTKLVILSVELLLKDDEIRRLHDEIRRLHAFTLTLAGHLADAAEVLEKLATGYRIEKKEKNPLDK